MHDQLRDTVTWQRCLCSYRQRKIDHNFINLTTPWPEEEHEFAANSCSSSGQGVYSIQCIRNSRERRQKAGEYLELGISGENQAKGKKVISL